MAIPDFQAIMLPLLTIAGDQQEHSFREAAVAVSEHLQLTETERKELLVQEQVLQNIALSRG